MARRKSTARSRCGEPLDADPEAVAVAPAPPDTPLPALRAAAAQIETISLIFDPFWYLWKYRDVEIAGLDPVAHYFADGHREGRDPNPFFSTAWYLSANPDVSGTGSNPFLHYILYGAREGRKPRP